jgi:hypothetical protein
MKESITFEDMREMFEEYGEPCSNCDNLSDGGWCEKGHRCKSVDVKLGHMPTILVRKKGGCPDHVLGEKWKAGWFGEDAVKPYSGVYGGTKTNILV